MINIRSLDTYIGRRVAEIGGKDDQWFVVLDGDVRVTCGNKNGGFPAPVIPNVEGFNLSFVNVIYGGSESTIMVLMSGANEWRIILDPLNYQIFDSTVQDTGWFPQVPVLSPGIPPWPFDDEPNA